MANPMDGSCSNPGCIAGGTKRCAACKRVSYCTPLCQKEDWPAHKAACKRATASAESPSIQCVRLKAQAGGASGYMNATISSTHKIFSSSPAPVTQAFGFPLHVQRPSTRPARVATNDNPHASWLMIDLDHGIAPYEWQGAVGDCLVVRADRKALDIQTLAAITDYVSDIMQAYSRMDPTMVEEQYYSRKELDKFIRKHLQMQEDYKMASQDMVWD